MLTLGHFQASLHGTRLIASFEGKDTKKNWNEQENGKILFRNLPM
jgi:hypothetical protein